MQKQHKIIVINGKEIHYSTQGKGIPVMLLHGYLENKDIWNSFLPLLYNNYFIITPDLPGHGASSIQENQTVETMANAMIAILEVENYKTAHLVGHSMGGYIALAILDIHPSFVKSFCLLHSHPFPDSDAVKQKRQLEIDVILAGKRNLLATTNIPNAFSSHSLKRLESKIEIAIEIACTTPEKGIIACLKAMQKRPDRSIVLYNTNCNTLLINGLEDNYISMNLINSIKLPTKGTKVDIKKVGHQSFLEEPKQTADILTLFWN